MVITNWRQAAPTIVHQYGIDYKLLKGQADFSPDVPNYCMRGMLYVAYAMLQTGKSYEAHAHGDHEEVYYIIAGHGTMTIVALQTSCEKFSYNLQKRNGA